MTEHPTSLFSPPQVEPPQPLASIDTTRCLDKGDLLLAMAAIDHSGRVPARRLLRVLGWSPGYTTSAQLHGPTITVQPDADSPHTINSRYQIFIPAGLRDLTGIRTTANVVLLAAPEAQQLIICPNSSLIALLRRGTPR
ncbi:hypothetical protein FXN61_13545 [Lentzea sp. PSKA42]|uniref:Uncharacterized protein n=1 Tax=Lentzea indica TaxID=2604800 RepID=A0ABX1FFQ5_9PSEU|nr:hypothetical protein [Lentzea indica]NKE57804.1 hypothetical protein [Lentzea indica]